MTDVVSQRFLSVISILGGGLSPRSHSHAAHTFGQCGTQCAACWDVWCSVGRLLSTCFLTPAESDCKHSAAVSVEQTGNQLELKPVATLSLTAKSENLQIVHQWKDNCPQLGSLSWGVCLSISASFVTLWEHTGSSSAAVFSSSSSHRRCAPACFWSLSRLTKAETKTRTRWCFTTASQLSLTLSSFPVVKYWSDWGLCWPLCR